MQSRSFPVYLFILLYKFTIEEKFKSLDQWQPKIEKLLKFKAFSTLINDTNVLKNTIKYTYVYSVFKALNFDIYLHTLHILGNTFCLLLAITRLSLLG